MATYSRLCSDEELEKARADLREILARRPIPDDQFKYPASTEEKEDKTVKKKKMKTYIMPKECVEMILSLRCRPIYGSEATDKIVREDKETYGDLGTSLAVARTLTKKYHDIIHAAQEELRREVETKGYYAYEATDDDEEEDDNGDEDELVARQQQGRRPRGKGRRRHRPGIVKHAGLEESRC